jgi:hypothetical protein
MHKAVFSKPAASVLAAAMILAGCALVAEKESFNSELAWWETICGQIVGTLENDGRIAPGIYNKENRRNIPELVQPRTNEIGYRSVGRMPLIDTALREPLNLPYIACMSEGMARESAGSVYKEFLVADALANQCVSPLPPPDIAAYLTDPEILKIEKDALAAGLPADAADALKQLAAAVKMSNELCNKAFAGLTADERKRLAELVPQHFLPVRNGRQVFSCFTSGNLDEAAELWALARKVDFAPLRDAGAGFSFYLDEALKILAPIDASEFPSAPIVCDFKTSFGRIIVGGTGTAEYSEDAAIILDLGGDDVYKNNAGCGKLGASVVVDLAGNDLYNSGDYSQGCAVCGIGALVDMGGNDKYICGNYGQASALLGFAFLVDASGNDSYTGGLGCQSFAIYGYAVLNERGGSDTYKITCLGQGCGGILGVALHIEEGGDDSYTSGGTYGFYEKTDAGGAQGSGTGIRMFPLTAQYTFYGGIGFLSEWSGNDFYNGANISQGSSYLLSLGMLVDSAGNDAHYGGHYIDGAGCHLSAGVMIERGGDDYYQCIGHGIGVSLDRSGGVLLEMGGNDTYAGHEGVGYAVKPNGIAVFAEIAGDDNYSITNSSNGYARSPYDPDTPSTGFFFDFSGRDAYANPLCNNNTAWTQNLFGRSFDTEIPVLSECASEWRLVATCLKSYSTLERFGSIGRMLNGISKRGLSGLLNTISGAFSSENKYVKYVIKDVVTTMLQENIGSEYQETVLKMLLQYGDPEASAIALWAIGTFEIPADNFSEDILNLYISSQPEEVRYLAEARLGAAKYAPAEEPIIAALKSKTESAYLRRGAAKALRFYNDDSAISALEYALQNDPDNAVRAFAANSISKIENPRCEKILENALSDGEGFVRFIAAKSLLYTYKNPKGMEALIALLDWKNDVVPGERILPVLRRIKGGDCPNREEWAKWWASVAGTFDLANRADASRMLEEAEVLFMSSENDKAEKILREALKNEYSKPDAGKQMSQILNARAWEAAVKGQGLEAALKEAEEAASLNPSAEIIDTLAVLYYLNSQKDKAVETLENAIKKLQGPPAKMLQDRLDEIKADKLKL